VGRITLVCTVHRERGLCNESELIRILETIGPDVIFEEIRPSDFGAYYRDKSFSTLETRAVSSYLKVRPTDQVAVDDYVIPDGFRREMDSLFEYVESTDPEYRRLIAERDQKTYRLGFRYLNSPAFEALSKRARESFEKTIASSGSEGLKKKLWMWNDALRRRDASMIQNIYEFCRKCPFKEGAFLVGAEHISSILEDIASRMKTDGNLVDWKRL